MRKHGDENKSEEEILDSGKKNPGTDTHGPKLPGINHCRES